MLMIKSADRTDFEELFKLEKPPAHIREPRPETMTMSMEPGTPPDKGIVWRIVVTIITLAAFLAGSLVYVAFYTSGFSPFQKIVVVLVALIISVTIVSIAWVTWAGRRGMIRGEWMPWK